MPLLQIGKRHDNPTKLGQRIYLSVSSEGYGHSSRALAIASRFVADDILIATYGYALERIKASGYPCVAVPQEVKFVGSEGSFDVGKTILQNPARALGLNQIVQDEINLIRQYGVSLVVADGRIAPVLAAARMDIPCMVVTNQSAFYPFFERDSTLVKLFGRSFEWVMKFWLSSAEEILIPDFPPPYTVCLPNLSANYQVKKRTRFVGPLVAWQANAITPISLTEELPRIQSLAITEDAPFVVVSLGGHLYRRPLFDAVLTVARSRPNIQFAILSPFLAEDIPANVSVLGVVSDCSPWFKAADCVITQAGHSTAMELLTLGKPSVIVPDSKQIEQENNARRMTELGVSTSVTYADLESSTTTLALALDQVLDQDHYRQQAQFMAGLAESIHGAQYTAGVLSEFSGRLSRY
jgi:UDP-N-acetylglucosamine--N-acetylmuramyl-(pentapeptide) pyrophosphoryl-undecaprenol N-acetylglucosamine transferase